MATILKEQAIKKLSSIECRATGNDSAAHHRIDPIQF
jgi:hypothetical protein